VNGKFLEAGMSIAIALMASTSRASTSLRSAMLPPLPSQRR
jgi:hypothetical protein